MPETVAAHTLWLFGYRRRRGWRGRDTYRRPRAWYAAVLGRVTRADLERMERELPQLRALFRDPEEETDHADRP